MGDMREYGQAMKAYHKERVKKNPERIKYAIDLLNQNNIKFVLVNSETGQINVKLSKKVWTFYCGTGTISGRSERGIHNFIKLLQMNS